MDFKKIILIVIQVIGAFILAKFVFKTLFAILPILLVIAGLYGLFSLATKKGWVSFKVKN